MAAIDVGYLCNFVQSFAELLGNLRVSSPCETT